MITISRENPFCTVMVCFTVDPDYQQELLDLIMSACEVIGAKPGFISVSFHVNTDGTQIICYLQWKSREDHYACWNSHEMAVAGENVMKLVTEGKATIDVDCYEIVFTAEG